MSERNKEHLQLFGLIEDAKVFTELACVNAEEGRVNAQAFHRYARAAIVFSTMATEAFLNFMLTGPPDTTKPKESDPFRVKLRWFLDKLAETNEELEKGVIDYLFDRISKTYALRNSLVHYKGEETVENTPLYLQGELKPENVVKAFVAVRTIFELAYPEIAFDHPGIKSILRIDRYERTGARVIRRSPHATKMKKPSRN